MTSLPCGLSEPSFGGSASHELPADPDEIEPAIRAGAELEPMYENTYESSYEVSRTFLLRPWPPPSALLVWCRRPYEREVIEKVCAWLIQQPALIRSEIWR